MNTGDLLKNHPCAYLPSPTYMWVQYSNPSDDSGSFDWVLVGPRNSTRSEEYRYWEGKYAVLGKTKAWIREHGTWVKVNRGACTKDDLELKVLNSILTTL